jgi:hypothetical protein
MAAWLLDMAVLGLAPLGLGYGRLIWLLMAMAWYRLAMTALAWRRLAELGLAPLGLGC